MELTHQASTATSVRLYPRLATKTAAKTQAIRRRIMKTRRIVASSTPASAAAEREEVRVRLLKMIVDNERARRQEPHAS